MAGYLAKLFRILLDFESSNAMGFDGIVSLFQQIGEGKIMTDYEFEQKTI